MPKPLYWKFIYHVLVEQEKKSILKFEYTAKE